MHVKLLNDTSKNETLVYVAARTCYSAKTPRTLWEDAIIDWDEKEEIRQQREFIKKIISRGHESVLEHASYTFAISGISRVCANQLVRHRIASYSQQSMRYVDMRKTEGDAFTVPDNYEDEDLDESVRMTYARALADSASAYDWLVKAGMAKEDARMVLPLATTTNLVMTMNARSLRNFFKTRLCDRAQWEIRELARIMRSACRIASPSLFDDIDPCKGCKEPNCPKSSKKAEANDEK